MATLSITIPDAIAARLRDSVAIATGYQPTMPNPAFDPAQPEGAENPAHVANPVSKMAWIKARTIEWLKEKAREGELQAFDEQRRAERQAVAQAIDEDLDLT